MCTGEKFSGHHVILLSLQVELAHHYQESGKCREKLAGVSQKPAAALLQPAHSLSGEFHCLPCNYSSEKSRHYQRHLKSQKHQRIVAESRAVVTTEPEVMDFDKEAVKVELEEQPSSSGLYQCLLCDYSGKDHKNYVKHLNTQKHQRNVTEERIQAGEEKGVTLARKAGASTVVTSSPGP